MEMENNSLITIKEHSRNTIAAIATPSGNAGVGVIRISGSGSKKIASTITTTILSNRKAHICDFNDSDGTIIDQGLAIFFPKPNSYTGEDVLELQGHGGSVVMDLLLKRVIELGCLIAKPGEFTERAFLNGKMDLTQAEAVSDLIESGSVQAAKASIKSMQGVFSKKILSILDKLVNLRVFVESSLDFSDEEIDFLAEGEIIEKLEELKIELYELKNQAKQGEILSEGVRVVIAGDPNVGKSSLLNAITGTDNAIVTNLPGTTRDVLREKIQIDGLPIHIIDTAGIRRSEDIIEQEGIKRTHNEVTKADRVLLLSSIENEVVDRPEWVPGKIPVDYVINKIDLNQTSSALIKSDENIRIYLSAKTGRGVDLLKEHLKRSVGYDSTNEGTFIARRRHLTALSNTEMHILEAISLLTQSKFTDLAAQELRFAQEEINEITGEFTSDDLLGKIFSSFCVGK